MSLVLSLADGWAGWLAMRRRTQLSSSATYDLYYDVAITVKISMHRRLRRAWVVLRAFGASMPAAAPLAHSVYG